MWSLRLLGGAVVRDSASGDPIAIQRRPLALLALLAVSGESGMSRDRLATFLWPESVDERARGALRQAHLLLRRSFAGQDPILGGLELRLDPRVVSSDVSDFESQFSAGFYEKAVATYDGPLLDGFHLGGPAEFDRWTATERERLSRQYAHAVEQLARTADTSGDSAGAVGFWRRATENEPLSGRAAIGLMRALAASGDSASAMQHARVHAVLIRHELDAEPDPAIEAYARDLRDGISSKPKISLETSSTAIAVNTPDDTGTSEHRASVHQELPTAIPNPRGRPTAVDRRARLHMHGRYKGLMIAGSLAAIVVAFVGLPRFSLGHALPPTRANRVLFAGFDNRTDDTAYTPLVRIADDWAITSAARVGGFDAIDARLQGKASPSRVLSSPSHRSELLELAAKVGANTLVEGSLSRVRDSLWFEMRISDAVSGRVIRSDEPVVATISDPMSAVRKLAEHVPARLAMATESPFLESANVSSAPATYESYIDFLAGTHHMWRGEYEEALAAYRRSESKDSAFSLPVVLSAFVFYEMGRCGQTDSIGRELAPVRSGLPRFDRIMLDRQLARCHGNWVEALRLAREGLELTPSSDMARGIVVDAALDAQRPEEAIMAHDSVLPNGRENLSSNATAERLFHALHFLGNHNRELNEVRLARRQNPGNIYLMQFEAEALAAESLTTEIEKVVDESMTAPPLPQLNPGELMQIAAAELRVHGYTAQAEPIEKRSLAWYALLSTDDAAMDRNVAGRALLMMQGGNLGRAAELYDSLVNRHPDSVSYHGALGVVEARRGNRSNALREDSWLASQRLPYILGANTLWRARIAARLSNRYLAMAYLRQAISEGQRVWCMHQILDWDLLRRDREFQEIMRPN